MKIGIVTRDENSWCSARLKEAAIKRGVTPVCFRFPQILARVRYGPPASAVNVDVLSDLRALIIRPIGRGSLDEIIFRMDVLHRLERLGMFIINPPAAIERSVDKFYALALLEENGIPIPRTAVTESHEEAMRAFFELGGDVVVKPIFGSRGIGSTRVSDPEVATRVFRAISYFRGVVYVQEFIPHGTSDVRAFVVGNRVISAMRRVAEGWKTNVSQGARPIPLKLDNELESLAARAAEVVGCKVAGVDILEGPNGPLVVEVNSQPGWRGLQSVTKVDIADEIISYVIEGSRR